MFRELKSTGILVVLTFSILLVTQINHAREVRLQSTDYLQALKLIGERKYDEAIQNLKQIIEKDSTFGNAYRKIVDVYKIKNDLSGAQDYFDALIETSDRNGYAYYGLGWVSEIDKNYEKAITYYKKAHDLACNFSPVYSGLATAFFHTDDTEAGMAYFKEIIKSDSSQALAFSGLGYLHALTRNWQESLANLERAVALNPGLLETLKMVQTIQTNQRNYDEAINAAQKGLALSKQKNDVEFEARFLNALGIINWYKNDYSKSLDFYENALRIFKDIGDRQGVARQIGNIAIIYENFGDYNKAVEYYNKSLQIVRNMENRDQESNTLGNLAIAYRSLGRYTESTESYLKAIQIAREIGDKEDEARHLLNLGVLRQKLADFSSAREYYQNALRIATEIKYEYAIAYIIKNVGDLYAELGLYSEAMNHYQRSLEKARELGDKRGEGVTLLYVGFINEMKNNYPESRNYYERALKIATELGRKEDELNAYNRLGSIYLKLGLRKEAQINFEKALALGKALGDPESTWQAYTGLADVYKNLSNEQKALEQLELAINEIENVRNQLFMIEESAGFFQSKIEVYERMIALLMQMHEKEPQKGFDLYAFKYAEKATARALLDLINIGQLFQSLDQIPDDIRQELLHTNSKLESIRTELVKAKIKDDSKESKRKIQQLQQQILTLKNDYDKLLREFRRAYPDLDKLMNPRFLSIQELQEHVIEDNQILIEYFVGETNSYVWLITKDKSTSTILNLNRAQIAEKLAEVSPLFQRTEHSVRAIAAKEASPYIQDFASWVTIRQNKLHELYQILFKPIIKNELQKGVELIIIPDDILFYFPFEMLVTELTQTGAKFLIEDYAVSYSASASLLNPELKGKVSAENELLAIGVSEFGQKSPSVLKSLFKGLLEVFREEDLVKLEYVEKEVKDIAKNFKNPKLLLDKQATEKIFKEQAENFQNIHFATHNLIDDRQPMYSKIVLAQTDEDTLEDGYLHTFELFNQKLNADLVVLSACNTGLGKFRRGEGLIGMSRAFMYAGVPSLVVSLWPVEDESTAYLMSQFYKYLAQGEAKNVALQKAKIDLIKSDLEKDAPFYWAPFVLIGDWK